MMSEEAKMTNEYMCNGIIRDMDELFDNWIPKEKYTVTKYTKPNTLKHGIIL